MVDHAVSIDGRGHTGSGNEEIYPIEVLEGSPPLFLGVRLRGVHVGKMKLAQQV